MFLCYSIWSEILNLNWTYIIRFHACMSMLVHALLHAGPAGIVDSSPDEPADF